MKYDEILIGQSAEITHTVSEEDVKAFGKISGDFNPLHFDAMWAKTTMFGGRIAHGLLSASFISAVIGMKLPGQGSVYLSQSLKFLLPVRIGDTITAHVEVIRKIDEKKHVVLKTTCINQNGETVIEGEALIKLMD